MQLDHIRAALAAYNAGDPGALLDQAGSFVSALLEAVERLEADNGRYRALIAAPGAAWTVEEPPVPVRDLLGRLRDDGRPLTGLVLDAQVDEDGPTERILVGRLNEHGNVGRPTQEHQATYRSYLVSRWRYTDF